jgi:hypothetical protein
VCIGFLNWFGWGVLWLKGWFCDLARYEEFVFFVHLVRFTSSYVIGVSQWWVYFIGCVYLYSVAQSWQRFRLVLEIRVVFITIFRKVLPCLRLVFKSTIQLYRFLLEKVVPSVLKGSFVRFSHVVASRHRLYPWHSFRIRPLHLLADDVVVSVQIDVK